jgi:ubiquinone/menaquinone biosynthesis C-methylase UbiE
MRKRIFILLGALALGLAVLAGVALLFGPTLFEMQEITVEDFSADGPILDIGGGGEGIIGRMKTTQVVAIDISREELADAPAGPLKIVMDATDLKFLDGSFATATSFYTLMYIPEAG